MHRIIGKPRTREPSPPTHFSGKSSKYKNIFPTAIVFQTDTRLHGIKTKKEDLNQDPKKTETNENLLKKNKSGYVRL